MSETTDCRVDLLSLEEAKEAAESVEMIAAFSELNIFRVLLHRPKTAKALADLLISLLFGGELDDRLRELLIMRIGWVTGSNYEWTQHWRIAREQFGCSEQDLLELRDDWRSSAHFGDDEKTLLAAVDALLEDGTLDADLSKRCLDRFGRNATIELATAVGCWRLVSKLTNALSIPLEEGIASWPPDGRQP
ncbi:MAG: carboxymuconolactone decarboxylase family protein [Deltaproteobacteria bacterium]|nr:carboxymuconolactone decarboxylase family protein [Deltaproteobacteria bacterium]MBW2385881.1 carboxymuconolactone decarboxylase family protein [Deltaproteobacteria bacterium]MBW2696169.1 carboxymuconolactone decarboxylase family protein [Deltaproteobacteria bacterium]